VGFRNGGTFHVTSFPSAEHHCPLTSTKLQLLVRDTQGHYARVEQLGVESALS